MGNELDGGARMEEIGGMIVHAEAAQAALDKGLAAHAENVANITRLIQYGGGVLKKLQAETEQLGPRAEQAGAGAVREEVRASLAGAGAVVGDAARAALRPVMADVVAVIGQAHGAGMKSRREGGAVFEPDAGDHGGERDRRVDAGCFRRLGCARLAAFGDREPCTAKGGLARRDRRHVGSFTKDAGARAENRVLRLQGDQRWDAPLRRRSARHIPACAGNAPSAAIRPLKARSRHGSLP